MSCPALSRYVEDRVLHVGDQRDALPWWARRRRRVLTLRLHALLDMLQVVYAWELAATAEPPIVQAMREAGL